MSTFKGSERFLSKKTNRLGLFSGPMAGMTVALHGLSVSDALNLVQRKLGRARRAGGTQIRIVHEKGLIKLRAQLIEFLTQCTDVESYEEDEENPCALVVYLS